ncbi:hypothetical protein WJX79_006150 [Trebouxia sp. C0005]
MALTQSKSCISLLGSTSVSNDSLNCHAFLMSSQGTQSGRSRLDWRQPDQCFDSSSHHVRHHIGSPCVELWLK